MWVMDLSSILVCKSNGLLVYPPCPWWSSRELDILYHLQVCLPWLGRLPCRSSSYNNSSFSKWRPWWLFYLSIQLLIFMILSNKISQLSLLDKILYLLLLIIALIRVMPVISVKAAIFILIALVRISLHLLWPLQRWVILDLHKHLIKWNIQRHVVLTSSWRWICLPIISILLLSRPSLLWMRALFSMSWEVCFHSLCSLPLLGNDCILCIHEALGWIDEFSHGLRLLVIKLVDE